MSIFFDFELDSAQENPAFLSEQLITYLGNKRVLLDFIGTGLSIVRTRLGKKKLSCFDVFSGSGIVSRYLKQYSTILYANDLEDYARVINQCYLTNNTQELNTAIDRRVMFLQDRIQKTNFEELSASKNLSTSFWLRSLYSPQDIHNIQIGERCFYTPRNAVYIQFVRNLIDELPKEEQHFFLAPLLSEASIHANTSGVFKGFYKNTKTGKGQFGGNNKDALSRIMGNIELKKPIFSKFDAETHILQGDANKIIASVPEVDLAYLDPPYNQHPYGSNYFMLNLIVNNKKPTETSLVSGIPTDWNRSTYNKKKEALTSFSELIHNIRAKFLLISFNSEGFISLQAMLELLNSVGHTTVLETNYNAFRASRNLQNRAMHVKEYLYLVEKNN